MAFRYLEQRIQEKQTEILKKGEEKAQSCFSQRIFQRETNTTTSVCQLGACLCTDTVIFQWKEFSLATL